MAPDIMEQAANWLDLEAELTDEQKTQFDIWLQIPEHAAAYKKMKKVMSSDLLSEAINQSQQKNISMVSRIKNFPAPLALAASVACILSFVYMLYPVANTPLTQPVTIATTKTYEIELSTPIAKRSSSMLKDGSHVHLNANSIVNISQTQNERLASLKQGQVFFDVAPDKKRPFIIDVGNSKITVVGTSFDVERTPFYTNISVYEGVVKVKVQKEVTLTKGQSIKIQSGQITYFKNSLEDMSSQWRSGWLEVNDASIVEVIAQLQGYLSKKVVFDDQVRGLRINGRFALDRAEESLMLISNTNQLVLHHEAQRIVLSSKQ
jgi:transmembrane sensor